MSRRENKKAQPILELKNVSKTFLQGGEKVTALRQTDLAIYPGEFVAVIGPSGSGKSTLLTIAGGLQNPTKGRVIIGGVDITKMKLDDLSKVRFRHLGFILQASNLVPFLKVQDQLILRDKVDKSGGNKAQRIQLLDELGISKLKDKYPSDLSGGERQRVAIAKVLYGNPDLILADEPTASLDTTKAYEVVELLARENRERGKATIMVTHDERLIKYCDRVFRMQDGVLTEQSRPKATRATR